MNRTAKLKLRAALLVAGLATLAAPLSAAAQTAPAPAVESRGTDELSAQDREAIAWANQLASEAGQIMERWVASKSITEEKLFSRLYYFVPKSDPMRYTTDYDTMADRDFIGPEEKTLGRSNSLAYAIVTDMNGYVPTHNQRYSAALTGNRAVDFNNNRTKRLYGDRTAFLAARSEAPYLVQRYRRENGEAMIDVSVPITVRGKHWGCVRLGYRSADK